MGEDAQRSGGTSPVDLDEISAADRRAAEERHAAAVRRATGTTPLTTTAGLAAMELYDEAAVARLNDLGKMARTRIREAIRSADAPASVTGAGSLFRIHMRSTAPKDYRTSFPTAEEKAALKEFITALYDHGIIPIHTAAGTLSTPMGAAEIDQLHDAVLASLQRVRHLLTDPR
jgi:glutamate-1-semialdehyde 2,1-aminomutase